MKVVNFEWKTHIDTMRKWLELHHMDLRVADELPANGLLVSGERGYIAAGFIRKLELSSTAMLDGFITNPKSHPLDRHEALDVLTEALIQKAKAMKFDKLISWTKEKNIVTRAERFGFQILPVQMIGLHLKGEKNGIHQ